MRHAIVLAALAAAATAATGAVHAQSYPAKPIRMIIPFPAAGATDILGRAVGQKLAESLGQPVVIDNRPGAGGNIGAEMAARALPDGYTLLLGAITSHAISAGLYPRLAYKLETELVPVSLVGNVPHVLIVHPSLPVKGVKDVVALAKSRPGQLNWASQGNGTLSHLEMELFRRLAAIDVVHVPYKGSSFAMPDLIAGNTQLFFDSIPPALPQINAGRLRAIAVASSKRSPALPDLPTISESGLKGFEADNWFGVLAPEDTPKDIVARLNTEIVKVVGAADLRKRMIAQGAQLQGSTPAELAAIVKNDVAKWSKVIRDAGVKLEQ
jgi:tripartite-type tricarboxylate transporter receptor subunit TctC